jgi:hypothetical protein
MNIISRDENKGKLTALHSHIAAKRLLVRESNMWYMYDHRGVPGSRFLLAQLRTCIGTEFHD